MITIQQLIEARLAHTARHASHHNLAYVLHQFLATLPRPDLAVTEIKAAHLRAFASLLQTRDIKPITVNHYVSKVKALLNWAGEFDEELEDVRAPRWRRLPGDFGRTRVLTAEEFGTLHRALRDRAISKETPRAAEYRLQHIADLFALSLLTAARPGELLALQRASIDFNAKTITFKRSKTTTISKLPLSVTAEQILWRRFHTNKPSERAFPVLPQVSIRFILKRTADKTGIGYGFRQNGWTWYTLRHTAATVMADAGIELHLISKMLGHSALSKNTTLNYVHTNVEALRPAVLALDRFYQAAQEEHYD